MCQIPCAAASETTNEHADVSNPDSTPENCGST